MMLTVEYVGNLLSQVESLTKELKDSESDNASLHRQLDHWQEISVHWKKERDVLAQERDALAMQLDIQPGSIAAVQAANQRMVAELTRPESTEVSLLRAERDALVADAARYRFITDHIVDEGDMDVLERAFESMDGSETCTQAEFNACIDAAIVKEQRQTGIK